MNIQLTNDSGSLVLPALSPPLTEAVIEGAQDVQTLDNNISTYFTANKRQWTHTWPYMTNANFLALKSFYDAQWTSYQYPYLTIGDSGIHDVPVRMYLDPKKVIDNCATVQDVSVTFRETRQMPDESS